MKKMLVILISVQLLFGNTLLPELAKLPQLFEHFKEHKIKDTALSFFAFLKMHYADPVHQESDKNHHQKLPLKSTTSAHAEVLVLQNNTPSVEIDYPILSEAKQSLNPTTDDFINRLHAISIFQPPRA
jgi:hypothetical protein